MVRSIALVWRHETCHHDHALLMSPPDENRTKDAPPLALDSIDETQAGDSTSAAEAARAALPLERGSSLGRYVILDRLGRGGMGVVYAAYDPELDRKIALEVLHDTDDGPEGRRRSQRLVREAQAMAQLSHPNVITVHDVGTFEGRVFFAMELVEGHTLTAWLRLVPRAWAEIVETFVAAGRGLRAAREAGLVHRDFKPDNVLVGADGRVRVTDFGIARPPRSATGSHASLSASSSGSSSSSGAAAGSGAASGSASASNSGSASASRSSSSAASPVVEPPGGPGGRGHARVASARAGRGRAVARGRAARATWG